VLGIGFIILGKLVEEQSEGGFGALTNRAMASVVLGAFGFLLWKVVRYEHQLFRLSTSDSLTGALNRRHFMAQMGREQKRAERYGARYSLLMLDIDHFKRINDSFGHQVGDEAIRRMADTCNAHLRPTDLLCRYGGEEFIIALTHTEQVGALIAAERIREAVAKIEIPADGKAVRYTVSIGVAPFGTTARLEDVIEAADQALYAAKTGGRNQVCVAGAVRAPTKEAAAAALA
jgi:diguanylate cyclase (GGDEF)-like protein